MSQVNLKHLYTNEYLQTQQDFIIEYLDPKKKNRFKTMYFIYNDDRAVVIRAKYLGDGEYEVDWDHFKNIKNEKDALYVFLINHNIKYYRFDNAIIIVKYKNDMSSQ